MWSLKDQLNATLRHALVVSAFFLGLVALAALAGCAVSRDIFLPVDTAHRYEGKTCGSVPYGGWRQALPNASSMSVNVSRADGMVWIGMTFGLTPGTSVRFLTSDIRVDVPATGQHISLPFSTDSGLPYRSLDASMELKGSQPIREFWLNVKTAAVVSESFQVTPPRLLVNGEVVAVAPIEFILVRRTGVMTCVQ
jgi:hypothetical protein